MAADLLTGFCHVRLQTASPVRILNRLQADGIPLYRPALSGTGLSFRCPGRDYARVCQLLQEAGIADAAVEKRGLPYFFATAGRKAGLFLFLSAFLLPALLLPHFVMEITVSGNRAVNSASIRAALAEEGVREYAFIPGLSLKEARQQLLLSQPRLCWAAVNLKGNRIEVLVKERSGSTVIRSTDPCNIVAAADGVLCRMEVFSGKPEVSGRTAVRKGQLLVSGLSETGTGELSCLHASARITAELVTEKTFSVNLHETDYLPCADRQKRRELLFFNGSLPLFFPGKEADSGPFYTAEQEEHYLSAGEFVFPLGLRTTTLTFYQARRAELTEADALVLLDRQFERYEKEELSRSAVLSSAYRQERSGDCISRTGVYRIQTDIAREVPILVKNPEGNSGPSDKK